jgi:hypothetical protein
MAVEQQDRDSYTGYLTTGHEWNGIKELNTPVPSVVYFFLTLAVLFSIGYWILMPAWPFGCELRQRPARHRSTQRRSRVAEGSGSRSQRLEQEDRDRELCFDPVRPEIDGDRARRGPRPVRR